MATVSAKIRVLHPKSLLAVRPEFDLFSAPLTDASIAHTTYEAILPTYPIAENSENQVISLYMPKDPVHFIDLSRSYLEIYIKGVGPDALKEFGSGIPAVVQDEAEEQFVSAPPTNRRAPNTAATVVPAATTTTTTTTSTAGASSAAAPQPLPPSTSATFYTAALPQGTEATTAGGGELALSRQRRQLPGGAADRHVPSLADEGYFEDVRNLFGYSGWMPVNNIGASLFEIVKINVNEYNLFHSSHYPYQALMTKLLNVSRDNLSSVQGLAYFALEEKNKMNGYSFGKIEALKTRAARVKSGKTLAVYDRLYIPITYSRKLLPNNVAIRIELTQSKSAFSILAARENVNWTGANKTPQVKLQITGLTWHVCKVRPYDYLLDSINARLLKEPALYFFPRRDVRVFIIGAGSMSFHQVVFQGRKPASITIAMVKDSDALGNYFTTPFGFGSFGLRRCSLTVNNLLPSAPLEFDVSRGKWHGGYRMLADATGHNSEFGEGPLLTPDFYTDGNFLLHYPLTNNLSTDQYLENGETCNVNLSLEFSEGLTDAVRLIMLARFDDFVECFGAERTFVPSYAML